VDKVKCNIITSTNGRQIKPHDKHRIAKEQVRECEERYRLLLDGIKDYAVFMMDTRGRIVSWNVGAERIKGYTAEPNYSVATFPAFSLRKTSSAVSRKRYYE
jgi:PAS domain-containing protein